LRSVFAPVIVVSMGTSGQFQELVAGWKNQPLSSWEKFISAYRHEGVIPKQKPGGGKNSLHLNRDQYVLLTLGIAAPGPSEAVSIARRYASLRCQQSDPVVPELPKGTLSDVIGEAFDVVALALSKGEHIDPLYEKNIKNWELILSDNPFVAYVISNNAGDTKETYFFYSDPPQWGALHRMTMFSGDLLLDVGRMLAESYMDRARQEQLKLLEKNRPSKTRQRPESAGDLRQEAPPAPSENPTRANGSEGSHNAPEGNNDGKRSQGHPVSDAGQVSIGKLNL